MLGLELSVHACRPQDPQQQQQQQVVMVVAEVGLVVVQGTGGEVAVRGQGATGSRWLWYRWCSLFLLLLL